MYPSSWHQRAQWQVFFFFLINFKFLTPSLLLQIKYLADTHFHFIQSISEYMLEHFNLHFYVVMLLLCCSVDMKAAVRLSISCSPLYVVITVSKNLYRAVDNHLSVDSLMEISCYLWFIPFLKTHFIMMPCWRWWEYFWDRWRWCSWNKFKILAFYPSSLSSVSKFEVE